MPGSERKIPPGVPADVTITCRVDGVELMRVPGTPAAILTLSKDELPKTAKCSPMRLTSEIKHGDHERRWRIGPDLRLKPRNTPSQRPAERISE